MCNEKPPLPVFSVIFSKKSSQWGLFLFIIIYWRAQLLHSFLSSGINLLLHFYSGGVFCYGSYFSYKISMQTYLWWACRSAAFICSPVISPFAHLRARIRAFSETGTPSILFKASATLIALSLFVLTAGDKLLTSLYFVYIRCNKIATSFATAKNYIYPVDFPFSSAYTENMSRNVMNEILI